MSYTSRPPFTGGMSNQNQQQQQQQQQQQGGQPNNANIGASGIPNIPMINNAASIPGNHLANSSGSQMSVIDQKIFQQQLLLQRQLLMQGQPYQQQPPPQQNQQVKFQQQSNQTQALNRIVSEMMIDKNGATNVAQQTQLQQIVHLQALNNMLQYQKVVHQQKSFQQQQPVPLPTNTTITPVARQNMQSTQKPPVNYPRSNVQTKNLSQNVSSSPMQSRKSFPNAPKSAVPQMQAGIVAAPLNISSSSVKSTLPQMPSAMTSAASSAKGYADILAASLSNSQASMKITPSLTITKTSSPSSSTSYAKNSNVLPNKPALSPSMPKSFLPEAISMSLGNVPLSVKASQPPSVTVTPTNKPHISPTNKAIPITPLKTNSPQNVPGLQKLSPTSPRTKQTPRKNTNPIRTTSLSPATQTSSQSAVPHVEMTAPSVSISPSSVKPTVPPANATVAKPPSINVVPPTPPKANVPALVAPVTQATAKPPQLTPLSNLNSANAKPNVVTPKIETSPTSSNAKPIKVEDAKSVAEVKVEKTEKVETIKTENVKVEKIVMDTIKTEKPLAASNSAASAPKTPQQIKPAESKSKQTESQSATITQSNTNQSEAKATKDKIKEATVAKSSTDQTTKTPVAKLANASLKRATTPTTPVLSGSVDVRAKRNRFKTIPYQSPTPEIELVSKISAAEAINAHKKKAKIEKEDDKLTLFYKNEFLAVRNADGGFFLCQAMNNVYKSSPKIRIRWLSEEATSKNIYCLDFYDSTDIECVLTSVSLNKMAKAKFQLTKSEQDRIESILKKALDVEKGIVERPDVTEENPDGLDLSLYKNESQIESKKTSGKRKASAIADSAKKTAPAAKKRKSDSAKPPAKTKADSAAKSAKKLPAEKDDAKISETADENQSTPSTKRLVTQRRLVDETNEVQNKDDSKTDAEVSKDGESETKVSKIDGDSPKQPSEKESAAESVAQSGRATRRSKN
ncbi:mucin-2-like [Sitodiplosis mosellana]|uniref:mucin-2-like n=1 Tax=Sitodiplosis mosellana TaxID=263140 RepID=UPI0024452690|nr:mucin-2-like [Sitodiplosis mosellana]XP_055304732.1 mucin-2-like [Sitodiplosis mosellana]XP_055304734.1 mucin-2-like [Sitodiplosis mosellana]XP_055304735.1 mucin-2-like [Sitodiplosis mosellana]XP_055304736.1 mucin-2-like [Sitodiplosis mosellana]XP_055304737.1 mucin-2-like [Sitodiplosis mosellana]